MMRESTFPVVPSQGDANEELLPSTVTRFYTSFFYRPKFFPLHRETGFHTLYTQGPYFIIRLPSHAVSP